MNLSYLYNFIINNSRSSRLINLLDLTRISIIMNLNLPNLLLKGYYLKFGRQAYKQNLIIKFLMLHIITIKSYLYSLLINTRDLRYLFNSTDQQYFKLIDHSYPSHFPAVKFHRDYTSTDNIQSINQLLLMKSLDSFVLNRRNSFLNILT